MKTIKFWLKNARTTALPQSMLPALLAVSLALNGDFSPLLALLAVIGVCLGHLGINLFDDYFDYQRKNTEFREKINREGMRARMSKCTYLLSGEANVKQLLAACIVFSCLALLIGCFIYFKRGEIILYIALITAVLGYSYSGSPLRLSYRGLGDLVIGFVFGPLLMVGVYYSACGQLDTPLYFISIPIGLLVANVVYTHSIMDFEPDRKAGKMTLAVLLRKKSLMLSVLCLFLFLPYGLIAYAVLKGLLFWAYLFVFLTFPIACALYYLMIQFVRDPAKSFSPRFWMGPMNHWERICSAGVDWFMIRWYLARNLLSFFCLILIVINLFQYFIR